MTKIDAFCHVLPRPYYKRIEAITDVDGSLEEIDHVTDDLGALGVQLYTNVQGRPLDGDEFEPIFREDGPARPDDLGAPDPERHMGRLSHRGPVPVRDLVGARVAVRQRRVHGPAGCIEFFRADRVLFASDSPFDPEKGPAYTRATIANLDGLGLASSDLDKIYEQNARRLLGVEA